MYENLKNRIAALEEEEEHGEEEHRRIAEEARQSIKGASESAIQTRYLELFQEMKRVERDHAREKQKLTKDKDASKSQVSKLTKDKAKLENLGRELSKENKKLRDDIKSLRTSVEEARNEIVTLKKEMERRTEKLRRQERKFQEMPDIVVKVVCKYRAELFFKISRKTKLSRLFNAWTERMDINNEEIKLFDSKAAKSDGQPQRAPNTSKKANVTFVFTHKGRVVESTQTPEEIGLEDSDEILAIEMLDLTKPEHEYVSDQQRHAIESHWTEDPTEAKRAIEEVFDGVVRERLKEFLRQYELREKHFECVVRSKELEVLLSRARAEEQKQLAEKHRALLQDSDNQLQAVRLELDSVQEQEEKFMDDVLQFCKELPPSEQKRQMTEFVHSEMDRRGIESAEGSLIE